MQHHPNDHQSETLQRSSPINPPPAEAVRRHFVCSFSPPLSLSPPPLSPPNLYFVPSPSRRYRHRRRRRRRRRRRLVVVVIAVVVVVVVVVRVYYNLLFPPQSFGYFLWLPRPMDTTMAPTSTATAERRLPPLQTFPPAPFPPEHLSLSAHTSAQ